MSDSLAHSFSFSAGEEGADKKAASTEKAPAARRGGEPIRWEVVAEMPGLLPAQIVAGRLQAEGIPTRAWQESVGQLIGAVVGPLGTGYVAVPAEYVDRALAILDQAETNPDEADGDPYS